MRLTFDPRAFNGLSKRLVPGEDQTIDNGASTLSLLALEGLTESVVGYGGDPYEVIEGRHDFEGHAVLGIDGCETSGCKCRDLSVLSCSWIYWAQSARWMASTGMAAGIWAPERGAHSDPVEVLLRSSPAISSGPMPASKEKRPGPMSSSARLPPR